MPGPSKNDALYFIVVILAYFLAGFSRSDLVILVGLRILSHCRCRLVLEGPATLAAGTSAALHFEQGIEWIPTQHRGQPAIKQVQLDIDFKSNNDRYVHRQPN